MPTRLLPERTEDLLAWQMLEVWIQQQTPTHDREDDGYDMIESTATSRETKVRLQLSETLSRVKKVTQKLLVYFDEARDGDENAGRKALGEDAQLFVKVSCLFGPFYMTF